VFLELGVADSYSFKSNKILSSANDMNLSLTKPESAATQIICNDVSDVSMYQEVLFSRKSSATTDELLFEGETSPVQSTAEYADEGLHSAGTDIRAPSIENNNSDSLEKLGNEVDGVQDDVTQIQFFSFINNGSFKFPNAMFDAMTSRSSKYRKNESEDDLNSTSLSNEDTSSNTLKRKFESVDDASVDVDQLDNQTESNNTSNKIPKV
jgi:hypothetical protein